MRHTNYRVMLSAALAVGALAFAVGVHAEDETKGDVYSLDVCPVSGEKLSAMSDVVKYNHEGRDIRFCCAGCVSKFEAASDKFIAKIDTLMAKQQQANYPLTECVVAGNKLGSMGEPLDVVVDNRLVRLCCSGCEKKLKQEPAAFIAKIDAAVIKQQMASYPFDVCMVSGEKLSASHGKAIDTVVANRLVRLCCAGCETTFNENPAKYLHMLDTGKLEVSADEGSSSKHEESDGHEGHGEAH